MFHTATVTATGFPPGISALFSAYSFFGIWSPQPPPAPLPPPLCFLSWCQPCWVRELRNHRSVFLPLKITLYRGKCQNGHPLWLLEQACLVQIPGLHGATRDYRCEVSENPHQSPLEQRCPILFPSHAFWMGETFCILSHMAPLMLF